MPTYSPCISIHSPYTGRDKPCNTKYNTKNNFNPLSLYRERRYFPLNHINLKGISIHSPYTGRDCTLLGLDAGSLVFQSTLPIQGETAEEKDMWYIVSISIHSPYTGRDKAISMGNCPESYFNPLSLYRERRSGGRRPGRRRRHFNPLSLYRERLKRTLLTGITERISIHSPYTGRDSLLVSTLIIWYISIHSPYTGRDNLAF